MNNKNLGFDLNEAMRFIEALTGNPRAVVTFQTFDDVKTEEVVDGKPREKKRGRGDLVAILKGTIEDHFNTLCELNEEGAGIFVQINVNDGNGRKSENIIALRALFADKDNGNFPDFKLKPTILVQTVQGQHVYFVLKDGESVERFRPAQQALIRNLDSDKGIHNLDRVMRLPGFFHMKNPAQPTLIKALSISNRRYSMDEVLRVYPITKASRQLAPTRDRGPTESQPERGHLNVELQNLVDAQPVDDGTRNQAVKDIVVRALGWGMANSEILKGLSYYCEKSQFDFARAEEVLRWAAGKHAERAFENYANKEKFDTYEVVDGSIHWNKKTQDGPVPTPLCNFSARIVSEEVHDDGIELRTLFKIEGRLSSGRALFNASVVAKDFSSLAWVTENWGTQAVVYAGSSKKDHLRAAIQILSEDAKREHVYAHFGFRKISGEWMFLHSKGAITANGFSSSIQVNAGNEQLSDYLLPEPPTGSVLAEAVRASLSFLEVAKDQVSFPLLAATYRAPLGEFLKIDSSIFVAGPSGNFKSELTALMQGHFGLKFNSRNFPGNWTSTENFIERQSFLTKDCIFTVDDFNPKGTVADVQRLHQKADRVLRAQGNGSGRGRMNADGSLRRTNFPRCQIISSGEDIPNGYSLRARMLIVEMSRSDVNVEELTRLQRFRDAGLLAAAMSAYVRWLIPQADSMKARLSESFKSYRERAGPDLAHGRTPDILASLMVGMDGLVSFAQYSGVLTEEEGSELLDKAWRVFVELAKLQGEHLTNEEPAARFMELLKTALLTGKAYLDSLEDGVRPDACEQWGWKNGLGGCGTDYLRQGEHIGWVGKDEVYLEPNAAYAVVSKMAQSQNEPMPITKNTLWKRLIQKDIARRGHGKNLSKKTIRGVRRQVLVIPNISSVFSG
ncbi:MAG: hypothetical protein JST16_05350 [Bdellovibrionales bacterium]|nr:hypothetical protein [Bdellovibrionales bacterium]